MRKKRSDLTRWAAAVALCWYVTPTPSALADNTPACVARVSAYVSELEQLFSTQMPWYRSPELRPYDELNRKYFPFDDCDGDPVLIEATKSRFFQGIEYNPRAKSYLVEFSNKEVRTGFCYSAKQRKVGRAGVSWVRDSFFNP